jgi:hypothetical protein
MAFMHVLTPQPEATADNSHVKWRQLDAVSHNRHNSAKSHLHYPHRTILVLSFPPNIPDQSQGASTAKSS